MWNSSFSAENPPGVSGHAPFSVEETSKFLGSRSFFFETLLLLLETSLPNLISKV